MMKPILIVGALALAVPALAQQQQGTRPGGGTQTPGQQTVSGNTPGTSGTEEVVSTADTSVQAAGTTTEEASGTGMHHRATGTGTSGASGRRIVTGGSVGAAGGVGGAATANYPRCSRTVTDSCIQSGARRR